MGGFGSTRWNGHTIKVRVEDCLELTVKPFLGRSHAGTLTWSYKETKEKLGSLSYSVQPVGDHSFSVHLRYTFRDEPVTLNLGITSTRLHSGGTRYWFICPMRECGKRCAKLYLAPGCPFAACRICHDLTYTSCQESHNFDKIFAILGKETGISPKKVKNLLK